MREHILVVEDSASQAQLLRHVLESASFAVEVATSGHTALDSLKRSVPRLVITDFTMPVLDGCELCRAIREDPRLSNLPVVLLTTFSDEDRVLLGLEAGADSFISKPFEGEKLLERVREVLAASPLEGAGDLPPLELLLSGKRYFINASRRRILSYLASMYEDARQINERLARAQADLKSLRVQGVARSESSLGRQVFPSRNMEAIGRLAAGVAHDFNNVLQVIQGFTDYLLGKTSADDAAHKPLQQIRKASEKASALTQQLLAFSGRQEQFVEVLDLGQLVEGLAGMLHQLVGAKVRLNLRAETGLWKVKADRGQLEQALLNLAANSRDAIQNEGEVTIEVTNRELEDGDGDGEREAPLPGAYVCILVRDTGVGMNRETMEHLFEPFFTTKEKGKGAGLGLATAYGVVRQSGGSLQCSSEVGKGTECRILLPRWAEATE